MTSQAVSVICVVGCAGPGVDWVWAGVLVLAVLAVGGLVWMATRGHRP